MASDRDNKNFVEEESPNYSGYRSFKDLECWKSCVVVRRWFSVIVKSFPPEEKYDLVSQMKRASRSSIANTAEGYGRFHFQENIQFCRISRGSLYELLDHLTVAIDENYISDSQSLEAENHIRKAISILNGYINYLQKQKDNK